MRMNMCTAGPGVFRLIKYCAEQARAGTHRDGDVGANRNRPQPAVEHRGVGGLVGIRAGGQEPARGWAGRLRVTKALHR